MIIPAIFDRPRHISLFRVGLAIIYKGLRTFRTGIFPVLTPFSHHQTESGKDRSLDRAGESQAAVRPQSTVGWRGANISLGRRRHSRVMTLIFC